MKLKKGVNPAGMRTELHFALTVADEIWQENGHELVVTSLNDSKHSRGSLHFSGLAADLRTRYFHKDAIPRIAQALRVALGNSHDYDVVVEKDHIHLEYQVKE